MGVGAVADVGEHVVLTVNGCWPSHIVPSPPMCEAVAVCCGLTSVAIQWQPMPASALLPSGTGVERLCGHPAQNPGLRIGAGRLLSGAPGVSGALSRSSDRGGKGP